MTHGEVGAITHFSGDPVHLLFWLNRYSRFWRSEIKKLYLVLSWPPEMVGEEIIQLQREILSGYPEITVIEHRGDICPELANPLAIPFVEEPITLFIESDVFVYQKEWLTRFIVDPIRSRGKKIVAADYQLLPNYCPSPRIQGLMRACMSVDTELLRRTDSDFMPQSLKAGEVRNGFTIPGSFDTDCFGWMSWQLLSMITDEELEVLPTVNNLNTQRNLLAQVLKTWPILHIRQFSSSLLGFNGPAFGWIKDHDPRGDEIILSNCDDWAVERSVVFRQIFLDEVRGVIPIAFRKDYEYMLEQTIIKRGLNRKKLALIAQQVKHLIG